MGSCLLVAVGSLLHHLSIQSQLLVEGHDIRAMLAEQENETESDSHVVRELLDDAKVQAALTEPRVRAGWYACLVGFVFW